MALFKWNLIRRRISPYKCSDFIVYKALSRLAALSLPTFWKVREMPRPRLTSSGRSEEETPCLQLLKVTVGFRVPLFP